jgi:hypothetical protein
VCSEKPVGARPVSSLGRGMRPLLPSQGGSRKRARKARLSNGEQKVLARGGSSACRIAPTGSV